MTLEEAIRFLDDIYLDRKLDLGLVDNLPCQEALKLGIEALKRIKAGRSGYTKEIVSKLPGETEE